VGSRAKIESSDYLNNLIFDPAPPRPNMPTFEVFDAQSALLRNSPLPLKISIWAQLLEDYPGELGILVGAFYDMALA
jgi:hypothetical protein